MSDPETTCPRCGTRNDAAARFCQECGEPLANPTAAPPIAVDAPASADPGAPAGLAEGSAASNRPDVPTSAAMPPPAIHESAPPATPQASTSSSASAPPPFSAPPERVAPANAAAGDGSQAGEAAKQPPSLAVFGLVLVLGAIALIVGGRQTEIGETLTIFSFCVGPIGLVLLVIGLVRLGTTRRR